MNAFGVPRVCGQKQDSYRTSTYIHLTYLMQGPLVVTSLGAVHAQQAKLVQLAQLVRRPPPPHAGVQPVYLRMDHRTQMALVQAQARVPVQALVQVTQIQLATQRGSASLRAFHQRGDVVDTVTSKRG